MKLINLFFLGAATLALGACSSLDDNSTWGSDGTVKFASYIEGQKTVKASGTQWTAGDKVGIYMKATGTELSAATAVNCQYTTDAKGNLTAAASDQAISYPETGSVDFVAYYPYTATVNGTVVAVDVASQTSQADIDLLYSDNAVNKASSSDAVNLGFSHELTNLQFTVTADATISSTAGLTMTLTGVSTSGTFDLATGTLTAASTTGNISLNVASDGKTAEGIVLPMTSTTNAKLQFTLNGQTVETSIPVSAFAAGTRYTIPVSLTISGGQTYVSFGTATITDWTDVPGDAISVDFGDGTVETDPDTDPDTPTGEEVTIFEETFGTPEKSGSYWPNFDSYTGYTSGMTFTDPYQLANSLNYSNGSVRSTSSLDGHAWFPANKESQLKIEGFTTEGYSDLTLTYDIATNTSGTDQNVIAVYYGDTQVTVPSATISSTNTYQTVTLTGLTAGFTSITFVSTASANTAGMRVDNIKLVGTK